jgi:hypothetical protein
VLAGPAVLVAAIAMIGVIVRVAVGDGVALGGTLAAVGGAGVDVRGTEVAVGGMLVAEEVAPPIGSVVLVLPAVLVGVAIAVTVVVAVTVDVAVGITPASCLQKGSPCVDASVTECRVSPCRSEVNH